MPWEQVSSRQSRNVSHIAWHSHVNSSELLTTADILQPARLPGCSRVSTVPSSCRGWSGSLADPSVQFSSVAQSCPTLCNPMDRSTPGFPAHHQLPELAQTHSHQVSDAIQPFFILCRPLLLPSIFPSMRVCSNESALPIRWPKYCSFSFSISPSSEYSGLISFRIQLSPGHPQILLSSCGSSCLPPLSQPLEYPIFRHRLPAQGEVWWCLKVPPFQGCFLRRCPRSSCPHPQYGRSSKVLLTC